MTIAEILHKNQPGVLFDLAIIYRLDWVMKSFFPNYRKVYIETEDTERLMMPSEYTGKVTRRRGRYRQEHAKLIR